MSVFIGKETIWLEQTASTNEHAGRLLQQDRPPDGTVVVARAQAKGRGQGNNSWESEAGKNLTFSLILYPDIVPPEELFSLSKVTSLGIADYLSSIFHDVSIKWPNDIYIQEDKVAGILIENSMGGNRIDYSIIGVGLNVNQTVFRSNAPNPTSMKLRAARDFCLQEVLPQVLTYIEGRYLQLFSYWADQQNQDYMDKLYRLNEYHPYRSQGHTFIARIVHVADNGQLVLQKQDGEQVRFHYKEVQFL